MYSKHGWIHLLKQSTCFPCWKQARDKISVLCKTDSKLLRANKWRIFLMTATKSIALPLILMASLHMLPVQLISTYTFHTRLCLVFWVEDCSKARWLSLLNKVIGNWSPYTPIFHNLAKGACETVPSASSGKKNSQSIRRSSQWLIATAVTEHWGVLASYHGVLHILMPIAFVVTLSATKCPSSSTHILLQ